ncbi:MAG: response regulator [Planctomycetes bacterium]|nr:response regulator [Planctomycetota bacterium]
MSGHRILLVDDDSDLRELVKETLSFDTHQVRQASTPDEAFLVLEREPIDLVILDLDLGTTEDGFEVCARIRELDAPPKVIMVTGSRSEADRDRCRELGAIAFLTKPFRPLELLELVRGLS